MASSFMAGVAGCDTAARIGLPDMTSFSLGKNFSMPS